MQLGTRRVPHHSLPMRVRLVLAIIATLAATGCDRPVQAEAEYRPGEAGTVDHALCLLGFRGVAMREAATGHHLVEAELNGRPATFMVDTGANMSVIHAPYAERFGVSGNASLGGVAMGIGGTMQARLARIDSLELGGIFLRQDRIALADLSGIVNALGPLVGEVHGIIGQDVLMEHRAVIDVTGPILHLIAADRDPAPVPADQCRDASAASDANDGNKAADRHRPSVTALT